MKYLLMLLCLFSVYNSPAEDWTILEYNKYYGLKGLHFTDSSRGVIWGELNDVPNQNINAFVKVTTDGGITWEYAYEDNLFNDGDSTGFKKIATAYILDNSRILVGDEINRIFYSDDMGQIWRKSMLESNDKQKIKDINFLDDEFGALLTSNLYFSYDSGENWEDCGDADSSGYYSLESIKIISEQVVYISYKHIVDGKFESAGFRKTTDGGDTWETIKLADNGLTYAFRFDFIDTENAFVSVSEFAEMHSSMARNRIIKTTDGGETFNEIFNEIDQEKFLVQFDMADANVGYAVILASGEYLKTTDGGLTFDHIEFDPGEGMDKSIIQFEAIDSDNVFLRTSHQIMKLDKSNSYGEKPREIKTNIYPNPCYAGGILNIVTDNRYDRISIINQLGNEIYWNKSDNVEYNIIELPQNLATGVYYLVLEQRGDRTCKPFIIK
jgi:photosystem II stability/assembly factor-like uncharacterized protein